MIPRELLREGIIQIVLGSAEHLLIKRFLLSFINLPGRIGKQFNNDIGEPHSFLPHHPTLALPILYVHDQEEIRSAKFPAVGGIVVQEHIPTHIVSSALSPMRLE